MAAKQTLVRVAVAALTMSAAGFATWQASEGTARLLIERLALAAQAATLLEWENPLADAFCTLRLGERGMAYGAYDTAIDTRAVLDRAMPLR